MSDQTQEQAQEQNQEEVQEEVKEETSLPASVSLREMKTYQTDDGRKIEVYTKIKEVPAESRPGTPTEFVEQQEIYVGSIRIRLPMGVEEKKFEIEAESLEEAFEKFHSIAEPVHRAFVQEIREAMQSHMQQQQQEEQPKVITAPAGVLNQLPDPPQGSQGASSIIQP